VGFYTIRLSVGGMDADPDPDADAGAAGFPDGVDLYWGEFHKHMTGPGADLDHVDETIEYGAQHLDVQAVLVYPFKWYRKGREGGIREETMGPDPSGDDDFADWWEQIQAAADRHNDPGTFVTFPAYEWHGNRTRWGDHNVLFPETGHEIRPAESLPDLYEYVAEAEGLALPHHTGYEVGNRGADWDVFDPDLSPVMEVYSSHGSSEGVGTAVAMEANTSMGPRTSGGTLRDALDRGHRIGVLASNDGPGLPGEWGKGVAGVWAEDLTREGVWSALRERRTYGVTGDRIRLWWAVDGAPMGADLADRSGSDPLSGTVVVDCPRALDRVELVTGDGVAATYAHRDRNRDGDGSAEADRYRVLIEFGWGPTREYGDFADTRLNWSGEVTATEGSVEVVSPRFVGPGQRYARDGDAVEFDLVTARDDDAESILPEGGGIGDRQGLVVEVRDGADADLVVDLDDGPRHAVPMDAARERAHLFTHTDESMDRIRRDFDLERSAIENPDPIFHNAGKVKVHPAHPVADCRATVDFEVPRGDATDYAYVRASQVDGQYAWSSPVWV
jgi:hypothetical protein